MCSSGNRSTGPVLRGPSDQHVGAPDRDGDPRRLQHLAHSAPLSWHCFHWLPLLCGFEVGAVMMMMLKHWVMRIMIMILKTAKKLQSILSQKRLDATTLAAGSKEKPVGIVLKKTRSYEWVVLYCFFLFSLFACVLERALWLLVFLIH